MSAQRSYEPALRTAIRPFAARWSDVPYAEFASVDWEDVFEGTQGRPPLAGKRLGNPAVKTAPPVRGRHG